MNKKKIIQLIVSFTISIGLLAWVFSKVDWSEVRDQLPLVRWWVLLATIPLMVFHFWIRSLRWRFLLPDTETTQYQTRKLYDGILVGNLASFILPFRLGEFVRPYVVSKWCGVGFPAAFVSVIVERLFDLAAVLFTFAILLFYLPDVPPLLFKGALSLGVMAICIMVFLILAALLPNICEKLIVFFSNFLPAFLRNPIRKLTEDLLKGAAALRSPARLIKVVLLTVAVWITAYAQFYFFSYLILDHVSILLATTTGVFVALAVALPSAPGFIGVYQAGIEVAFSLFAISKASAIIIAVVSHLFYYAFYVVTGIWGLNRNKMSFKDIGRIASASEAKQT